MANSPRVPFSYFSYMPPEKTSLKDVFAHSAVLISQLAGIKTLTLDHIYLLAVTQRIPMETIFKSVGPGLLELNLEKFGDLLDIIHEGQVTEDHHEKISKLLANAILAAGEYCPNLMRLELPTKGLDRFSWRSRY